MPVCLHDQTLSLPSREYILTILDLGKYAGIAAGYLFKEHP